MPKHSTEALNVYGYIFPPCCVIVWFLIVQLSIFSITATGALRQLGPLWQNLFLEAAATAGSFKR